MCPTNSVSILLKAASRSSDQKSCQSELLSKKPTLLAADDVLYLSCLVSPGEEYAVGVLPIQASWVRSDGTA